MLHRHCEPRYASSGLKRYSKLSQRGYGSAVAVPVIAQKGWGDLFLSHFLQYNDLHRLSVAEDRQRGCMRFWTIEPIGLF